MNKLSKVLFGFVGCFAPIFIGLLHTYVHFRDLLTPEIEELLQREFSISGTTQKIWYSWGIISFMMGASFITIGLLNISILSKTKRNEALPIIPILGMIVYQLSSVYVGNEFNQANQFYGGLFGLSLMSICLMLTLKIKS